jgi:hypothetical protein
VNQQHLNRNKNLETKITKISKQELQKSENKNYKNLGNKITKIWEQKIQKCRNKGYKNQKQKFRIFFFKNPGIEVKQNLGTKI